MNEVDKQAVSEVYENLKEYNKGKKPSEYMKKLMNSLKDVAGDLEKGNKVSAKKLDTLNKAALKYHDKRKGIFFGPTSDKGQMRLDEVQRLVMKTDKYVKEAIKEKRAKEM